MSASGWPVLLAQVSQSQLALCSASTLVGIPFGVSLRVGGMSTRSAGVDWHVLSSPVKGPFGVSLRAGGRLHMPVEGRHLIAEGVSGGPKRGGMGGWRCFQRTIPKDHSPIVVFRIPPRSYPPTCGWVYTPPSTEGYTPTHTCGWWSPLYAHTRAPEHSRMSSYPHLPAPARMCGLVRGYPPPHLPAPARMCGRHPGSWPASGIQSVLKTADEGSTPRDRTPPYVCVCVAAPKYPITTEPMDDRGSTPPEVGARCRLARIPRPRGPRPVYVYVWPPPSIPSRVPVSPIA